MKMSFKTQGTRLGAIVEPKGLEQAVACQLNTWNCYENWLCWIYLKLAKKKLLLLFPFSILFFNF